MSNSAKVDQKGRLKIPVTLFRMLKRSGTELYVTSEDGYSVRIYPMQVWDQVEERLERLCSHNRNNQKLLVHRHSPAEIFRPGCDDGQEVSGCSYCVSTGAPVVPRLGPRPASGRCGRS